MVRLGAGEAVWIDCDFHRAAGTMGAVAGERIVRAVDAARDRRVPIVQTVSSGGARLQEGMVALLQMPRTVSAFARHAAAGLMSAAYLRSPATGGVFASFASLADVRAAEPGAVIGFGGPRVVEEVTGAYPPDVPHRRVGPPARSRGRGGRAGAVLGVAGRGGRRRHGAPPRAPSGRPATPDRSPPSTEPYAHLLRARGSRRPSGVEWAAWITDSWVDLAGPDPAVRAGLATVDGHRAVVVAMDRFAGLVRPGAPGPAAYRTAQRAVRLAGRLGLPLLTIVDTPSADPSVESEAGGIAGEIARTLLAMAELRSASVGLVVGEGGSGGAVALAHTDRLLMLAGSTFSVIGPEAAAAILYRERTRTPELAAALRMRAADLRELGVADQVVAEEVTAVRAAVAAALAGAVPGARDVRPDRVTAGALREPDIDAALPFGM